MRKPTAEQREAKRNDIHELVNDGSLTVRQMTAEERTLHLKRPASASRRSYWSK